MIRDIAKIIKLDCLILYNRCAAWYYYKQARRWDKKYQKKLERFGIDCKSIWKIMDRR